MATRGSAGMGANGSRERVEYRPTRLLRVHPDCELVPAMRSSEYRDLLADIREHGIKEPLVVVGNVVLDGRHRLRAARELGIDQVPVREIDLRGETEVGYILKAAALRRHLTDDQRAVLAAKWKDSAKAKRGRRRRDEIAHDGVRNSVKDAARKRACIEFAVPRRKVDQATRLLHASPRLLGQVLRGEIRLSAAIRTLRSTQGSPALDASNDHGHVRGSSGGGGAPEPLSGSVGSGATLVERLGVLRPGEVSADAPEKCGNAPVVDGGSADARPTGHPVQGLVGMKTAAWGSRDPDRPYEFEYRLMLINGLIISHIMCGDHAETNPAYPSDLQPRDRARQAYSLSVARGAAHLISELLLFESPLLTHGAPIVGPDSIVESGNGRILMLLSAMVSSPAKWAAYQRARGERCRELGFPDGTGDVEGDLVLVRVRTTMLTDAERRAFVREANEVDVQRLSPYEVALEDAGALLVNWPSRLETSETAPFDRALLMGQNLNLIGGFLQRIAAADVNSLVQSDYAVTPDLLSRLKRAMLVWTYTGDTAKVLGLRLVEATDPGLRLLAAAILDSLPLMAQAESLIRMDKRDRNLSIVEDIVRAALMLIDDHDAHFAVEMDIVQGRIPLVPPPTPRQLRIVGDLNELRRSGRRMRTYFEEYAKGVIEAPDEQQATIPLLGVPSGGQLRVTKGRLLDCAAARAKEPRKPTARPSRMAEKAVTDPTPLVRAGGGAKRTRRARRR